MTSASRRSADPTTSIALLPPPPLSSFSSSPPSPYLLLSTSTSTYLSIYLSIYLLSHLSILRGPAHDARRSLASSGEQPRLPPPPLAAACPLLSIAALSEPGVVESLEFTLMTPAACSRAAVSSLTLLFLHSPLRVHYSSSPLSRAWCRRIAQGPAHDACCLPASSGQQPHLPLPPLAAARPPLPVAALSEPGAVESPEVPLMTPAARPRAAVSSLLDPNLGAPGGHGVALTTGLPSFPPLVQASSRIRRAKVAPD